jgi:hypothetical protein
MSAFRFPFYGAHTEAKHPQLLGAIPRRRKNSTQPHPDPGPWGRCRVSHFWLLEFSFLISCEFHMWQVLCKHSSLPYLVWFSISESHRVCMPALCFYCTLYSTCIHTSYHISLNMSFWVHRIKISVRYPD